MARLRKTLPRDFQDLLLTATFEELVAVLERCELGATGYGMQKIPALGFNSVPDELTRWQVGRGGDVDAPDDYGRTPLWHRASSGADLSVLLELGADPNRRDRYGAPPIVAAKGRPRPVRQLLAAGVRVDLVDGAGRGLVDRALAGAANIDLRWLAEGVRLLLEAGAPVPPDVERLVTRLGENFEFHRSNFAPDLLEATSQALDQLYELFDVAPVPRRVMHEGTDPIVVAGTVEERFEQLWELLVPSSGEAATVQGEVVRIAGKLNSEMVRNGGANWSDHYRDLADTAGRLLASGTTVGDPAELKALVRNVRTSTPHYDEYEELCRWAADWVAANPVPVPYPLT